MPATESAQKPGRDDLLEFRTIALVGQIDEEGVNDIVENLVTLQFESTAPINLIIDSGGGSMIAALRLCDVIDTLLTAPVRGITLGACGSAATFVLLHCSERWSTPNSKFMIHSGHVDNVSIPINDASPRNVEDLLSRIKNAESEIIQIYTDRLTPKAWVTRRPRLGARQKFVRELIGNGDRPFTKWLSAEDALEVGLIERIVRTKLPIFPSPRHR